MTNGNHVTAGQCEMMRELDGELTREEIAEEFGVSKNTVRLHVNNRCAHGSGS